MQSEVLLCQRFLCKRPLSAIETAQLPAQNGAVDRGEVARDIGLEHVGVAPRLALIIIDGPVRALAGPAGVAVGDKAAVEAGAVKGRQGLSDGAFAGHPMSCHSRSAGMAC